MTSRAGNLLIIILVWAALYFPALGSLAIKGEEGRRILPGITMLQTGNYLVPQVGGETYFRKPPLINWLVVASFQIFGRQNEWTARMPSVISVLLVAIAFATVARASLGPRGSTIAALIWLINAGIIEKGRLVEIEGLYVSLCALAIIFWLSFWEQKKSAWLIWTVPFVFLGLGWLAKGPVHLLFFYGVVIAVVWKERSWRALFHPAHFVGIAVMLGIFAAWAIPFLQATDHATATSKWSQQFTGRLRGTDFEFGRWIFNIPHGVLYLLPWVIFLPLVRSENFAAEKDRQLVRALTWGALAPFVIVDLVPGSIPSGNRSTSRCDAACAAPIGCFQALPVHVPGALANSARPLAHRLSRSRKPVSSACKKRSADNLGRARKRSHFAESRIQSGPRVV